MARIPEQVYRRLPRRLPNEWRWSNYALRFPAVVGTYVSIPDHVSLNPTDAISLETWFKWWGVGLPAGDVDVIIKGGQYIFRVDSNGHAVIFRCSGGVYAGSGAGFTNVCDGFWHHLLGTYDRLGGLNNLRILVDGVQENQSTAVGAIDVTVNTLQVPSLGISLWAKIFVDEIRVLPVALSPAQGVESLQRGYARRELDARLVMRFEEGVGLTAYDESGYGNHGSLLPVLSPPTWEKVSKYELLAEAGI